MIGDAPSRTSFKVKAYDIRALASSRFWGKHCPREGDGGLLMAVT